jgi:hypothetical protein
LQDLVLAFADPHFAMLRRRHAAARPLDALFDQVLLSEGFAMIDIRDDDLLKLYFVHEESFWAPIGKFVFTFGMLERDVNLALSQLMDVKHDDIGQYILNELDFLPRVHFLAVYCRKDDSKFKERMKQIVDALGEHNTFRNDLVHGAWTSLAIDTDTGSVHWNKVGLSRRNNPKTFAVSIADITSRTEAIKDLRDQLHGLANDIVKARAASRSAPAPGPRA